MQKKFSIIITIYNKEKNISKCIESIINNKTTDYEIIIINDGSTDNSEKVIQNYTNKYKNICYYYQENKGISITRKESIKYIKGKYILFVDADDTINSILLHTLKENIEKYKPDLIKFNINEINSKTDKERYKTHYETIMNGEDAISKFSNKNIRYSMYPMYAIKKELFKSILPKYKIIKFYEDVANVPKIIYKAKKVLCLDFDGYNYYRNENSLSQKTNNKTKLKNFKEAHKELITYFKKELGENNILYKQIKEYYDYHLERKTKELK